MLKYHHICMWFEVRKRAHFIYTIVIYEFDSHIYYCYYYKQKTPTESSEQRQRDTKCTLKRCESALRWIKKKKITRKHTKSQWNEIVEKRETTKTRWMVQMIMNYGLINSHYMRSIFIWFREHISSRRSFNMNRFICYA